MTEPARVVVVVAHPHDFMHCAATCGIHIARGDKVTVVAMTSGVWMPYNETRSRHNLTALLGYYGMYAGAKYVEPFVREKMELLTEIRVPESALKRAADPVV